MIFLSLLSLVTLVMWNDLTLLYKFVVSKGLYSYMPFIPFISIYFLWTRKKLIFSDTHPSLRLGSLFCLAGMTLYFIGHKFTANINQNDYLSITISGWLITSLGIFITFYGWDTFKRALFPMLFLFFMVPIPSFFLNWYIELLRKGSEEVSYLAFKILNIPVYRLNNVFELPNFTLEVAKECSGIRSSIGLWITAILAAYIFLKKPNYRMLLLFSVIPIAILKNGLRIVTLGILASYVDPIYITNHWLHKSGGILYFTIALFLLFFPWLFFLRSCEERLSRGK